MDIGATRRQDVWAPAQLVLRILGDERANAEPKLLLLNDETIPGGGFVDYGGTSEELLREFRDSAMLGFQIIIRSGRFISVWPPNSFGSVLPMWRIVAEKNDKWEESCLNEIIGFHGIAYAAVTYDETLDLEQLDHVDKRNFPWDHWRLIAARVSG